MLVAPPARIDDGILDIVLMRQGPKLAFMRALMKIRDGSHVSLPQISLERGAEVTMTIDREMPSAADGETIFGSGGGGGGGVSSNQGFSLWSSSGWAGLSGISSSPGAFASRR